MLPTKVQIGSLFAKFEIKPQKNWHIINPLMTINKFIRTEGEKEKEKTSC